MVDTKYAKRFKGENEPDRIRRHTNAKKVKKTCHCCLDYWGAGDGQGWDYLQAGV